MFYSGLQMNMLHKRRLYDGPPVIAEVSFLSLLNTAVISWTNYSAVSATADSFCFFQYFLSFRSGKHALVQCCAGSVS